MGHKTVRGVVMLALVLLTTPLVAHAQPATKVYRLGVVKIAAATATAAWDEAFKQGLQELGYTEGQNLRSEWRFADGHVERLPALVAEVLQLPVDCLAVGGIPGTLAAQQATRTIPIVMLNASDDPVRLGLITSLARPGGNITGVIDIAEQLAGKRLELLQEAFPHLTRVGHLGAQHVAPAVADLQEVDAAARVLGVRVHPLHIQGPDALDQAFQAARDARVEALIVVGAGFPLSHRARIVQLVDALGVPVMYTHAEFVREGGLMSYGVDVRERMHRAATFVAKIFQGAQPADLPVEQPTQFTLAINLKTAQAMGLTIPPTLVFQADEVIR